MAAVLAKGRFHLTAEILQHVQRHEGLDRTGKAASVNTAGAPPGQGLLSHCQGHSHSLVNTGPLPLEFFAVVPESP